MTEQRMCIKIDAPKVSVLADTNGENLIIVEGVLSLGGLVSPSVLIDLILNSTRARDLANGLMRAASTPFTNPGWALVYVFDTKEQATQFHRDARHMRDSKWGLPTKGLIKREDELAL